MSVATRRQVAGLSLSSKIIDDAKVDELHYYRAALAALPVVLREENYHELSIL